MGAYLLMYDSIDAGNVPRSAHFAAGYIDGYPAWRSYPALAERLGPHVVSITVEGGDADCCDCETGDLTPTQAVQWVERQLAAGRWRPCVYANLSTWESGLRVALDHYGSKIRRWVAAYDGHPAVPAGYDAHQFTDAGPNGCDVSVCVPSFFPPAPIEKPKPKPKRIKIKRPAHPKPVKAAAAAGAGIGLAVALGELFGVKLTTAEAATVAASLAGLARELAA